MRRFEGKSALVVDDEPSTRLLLREALQDIGMTVTEANDGADAIHKSIQSTFDVTTMDIMMPNVDGLDAIRAMRMVDPKCRIIVVTSRREESTRREAHQLGITHFLTKPVRLPELYEAVQEELSSATEHQTAPEILA